MRERVARVLIGAATVVAGTIAFGCSAEDVGPVESPEASSSKLTKDFRQCVAEGARCKVVKDEPDPCCAGSTCLPAGKHFVCQATGP
jgi:hypothetical protein